MLVQSVIRSFSLSLCITRGNPNAKISSTQIFVNFHIESVTMSSIKADSRYTILFLDLVLFLTIDLVL